MSNEKTEKTKVDKSAENAEKKVKKAPPAKKPVEEAGSENFKGIVRIAGRDVRGHVRLRRALTYIKGVSHSMSVPIANVLSEELHISPDMKIGELQDSQIESIDKILFDLANYKIPKCLLNRRCDMETGADRHVIMNDLILSLKQDIEKAKKAYTWKGFRHSYGQKVRGQRTRNTGRTGMAVGVLRKTLIAQAGAQAAAGKEGAAAGPAGGKAASAVAPAGGKAAAPAAGKSAAPAAKTAEKK